MRAFARGLIWAIGIVALNVWIMFWVFMSPT